ncbi:MAG: hypothetical protein ABI877_03845 [Gemmatimonadaceae bacterium]
MLSIERTRTAVVACYATPQALDALPVLPGTYDCRVAPDEMLLVAPPLHLAETERRAAEHFAVFDPTALVLDQSDGWSAFSLRGDEGLSIFAQLSAVPLPRERPAFLQGAVAEGAAKILLFDGVIHLLVPSTLRHHLANRLNDVCVGRASVPDHEVGFVCDSNASSYDIGAATPALR